MSNVNRNKKRRERDDNNAAVGIQKKKRKLSTSTTPSKTLNKADILKKLKDNKYITKNRRIGKYKSSKWEHVLCIYDTSTKDEIANKCKYCDTIYSLQTSTNSWQTHQNKNHQKRIDKLNTKSHSKQLTLTQSKEPKFTKLDKTYLKNAAVKFVALDSRPFHAVMGDGYDHNLTAAYNLGVKKARHCKSLRDAGVLSDETTISRAVVTEAEKEKKVCIADFKKCLSIFPPPIHHTTDCSEWKHKKNGEKIIGVTTHWAKRNNPNIQITYTSCDNFRDKLDEIKEKENEKKEKENDDLNDSDNESSIEDWDALYFSSDDEDFDVEEDDIEEEEADYGGNYINLRKLIEHIFHEFELDQLLKEFEIPPDFDDALKEYLNNLKSTITTDNHSANIKAFGGDYLLFLILCFNHNWNLVIKWMIKLVSKKHKSFRRLLRLIRKLIKRIKKSNMMGRFDPTLKAMIEIRWQGVYESIKSICAGDNYIVLKGVCAEFDRNDLIIRIALDNLIKLRDFFENIVIIHKHFEVRYKPRMHHVIIYTHYVLNAFTKPQKEYSLLMKLKKEMRKQATIRMVPKITINHWKCLILNPKTRKSDFLLDNVRYKCMFTNQQKTIDSKEMFQKARNDLRMELKVIAAVDKYQSSLNETDVIDLSNIARLNISGSVNNNNNDKKKVHSVFSAINDMFEKDVEPSIEDECDLNLYFSMCETYSSEELEIFDDNPLILWNTDAMHAKISKLSRLSTFYFVQQAASSPSECLFGLGNSIMTEKRSALAYKKAALLLFLISRWKMNG